MRCFSYPLQKLTQTRVSHLVSRYRVATARAESVLSGLEVHRYGENLTAEVSRPGDEGVSRRPSSAEIE